MATATKKLTDTYLRSLKSLDKAKTYPDRDGLYLEVMTSGSKIWRMRYQLNKQRVKLTFGKYPGMSIKMARAKCDEILTLLAQGIDPRHAKEKTEQEELAKREHIFEKIAREWYADHLSEWKENTATDILRRFERDVFPALGTEPIEDIVHKQIFDMLKAVERRGAPETARRLRAYRDCNGFCGNSKSDNLGENQNGISSYEPR